MPWEIIEDIGYCSIRIVCIGFERELPEAAHSAFFTDAMYVYLFFSFTLHLLS